MLHDRVKGTYLTVDDVMQADLILYLREEIAGLISGQHRYWWPETLLYATDFHNTFPLFARAESTKFFAAIAPMLGVESKLPLVEFVSLVNQQKVKPPRWQGQRLDFQRLLGIDKLGSRP
jgi:hypothetical protein